MKSWQITENMDVEALTAAFSRLVRGRSYARSSSSIPAPSTFLDPLVAGLDGPAVEGRIDGPAAARTAPLEPNDNPARGMLVTAISGIGLKSA